MEGGLGAGGLCNVYERCCAAPFAGGVVVGTIQKYMWLIIWGGGKAIGVVSGGV